MAKKFGQRNIKQTSPSIPYSATDPSDCINDPQQGQGNQFNMVSGGQLLPERPVCYLNKKTNITQMLNIKSSVNIRIRYDANEPKPTRWNIDVYVDMESPNSNWNEKRLVTKRLEKVHKAPDSKSITVEYWIDGVKQNSIVDQRPKRIS